MQDTRQSGMQDRHWAEKVRPGDVVIFRFPLECAARGQHAKSRPCLVTGIEDDNGERRVRLAYGSSVIDHRHGRDRIVRHPSDLAAAGLRRPTRFEMTRQISVAPDDPRFVVSGHLGTAVTGHLDLAGLRRPRRRHGYLGRR